MKIRLTVIAAVLSVLATGAVYAGGAGGCDYSTSRYTSAEPQEPTAAEGKLASLDAPATVRTSDETDATTVAQPAEPATAQ